MYVFFCDFNSKLFQDCGQISVKETSHGFWTGSNNCICPIVFYPDAITYQPQPGINRIKKLRNRVKRKIIKDKREHIRSKICNAGNDSKKY